MILSGHILIGAALAIKIQNPILGFLSAFLSHYIADILPVWEYSIKNIKKSQWPETHGEFLKVFLDIIFGFTLFFIFSKDIFLGAIGGFLAMMPDGLTLVLRIFPEIKILKLHQQLHARFNWFRPQEDKKTGILPIILQVFVFFAVIYFLQ